MTAQTDPHGGMGVQVSDLLLCDPRRGRLLFARTIPRGFSDAGAR